MKSIHLYDTFDKSFTFLKLKKMEERLNCQKNKFILKEIQIQSVPTFWPRVYIMNIFVFSVHDCSEYQ